MRESGAGGNNLINLDKERARLRPNLIKPRAENVSSFKGRGPVAEKKVDKISKEECLAALKSIAPLNGRLKELMGLPDQLYRLSESSFSSKPDETAELVANHLLYGDAHQDTFPNYGIHISSKGTNSFCTLVDKKRKIVVHANVNNAFSSGGSWDKFQTGLMRTLAAVKKLEENNQDFRFVVSDQTMLTRI